MAEFPWTGRTDALPEEVLSASLQGMEFTIVDVRTAPEYAAYHIPGCRFIPMDSLAGSVNSLDPDEAYVVVCEHGIRSRHCTAFLIQQGFENVANMVGGMVRWPGAVEQGMTGSP